MKELLIPYCQDCKFHQNKPSSCTYDGNVNYVGRKDPICINFKRA